MANKDSIFSERINRISDEFGGAFLCNSMVDGFTYIKPFFHGNEKSFLNITDEKFVGIWQLVQKAREVLLDIDETIVGFNVEINVGFGDFCGHDGIMLIPCREGDGNVSLKKFSDICPFCDETKLDIVKRGHRSFTVYDIKPKAKGHSLVINQRHVVSVFDITQEELIDNFTSLRVQMLRLRELYRPEYFTIRVDSGLEAGQKVPHVHWHLFPRFYNDNQNIAVNYQVGYNVTFI